MSYSLSKHCDSLYFKRRHPDALAAYESRRDPHLRLFFLSRSEPRTKNMFEADLEPNEWTGQPYGVSLGRHQRRIDARRARMELRRAANEERRRINDRDKNNNENEGQSEKRRRPKLPYFTPEAWRRLWLRKGGADVEAMLDFLHIGLGIARPRSAPTRWQSGRVHSSCSTSLNPTPISLKSESTKNRRSTCWTDSTSNSLTKTRVTLQYTTNAHTKSSSKKRDRVSIFQQPCGTYVQQVFQGQLRHGDQLEFQSLREPNFPFSLTIYVNDCCHVRLSTCCEARRSVGQSLGLSNFTLIDLNNAKPCFKCLANSDPVVRRHKARLRRIRCKFGRSTPNLISDADKEQELETMHNKMQESVEVPKGRVKKLKRKEQKSYLKKSMQNAANQPELEDNNSISKYLSPRNNELKNIEISQKEHKKEKSKEKNDDKMKVQYQNDINIDELLDISHDDLIDLSNEEYNLNHSSKKEDLRNNNSNNNNLSNNNSNNLSQSNSDSLSHSNNFGNNKNLNNNKELNSNMSKEDVTDISDDEMSSDMSTDDEAELSSDISSDISSTLNDATDLSNADDLEDNSSSPVATSSKVASDTCEDVSSLQSSVHIINRWHRNVRPVLDAKTQLKSAVCEGNEISRTLIENNNKLVINQNKKMKKKRNFLAKFRATVLLGRMFFGIRRARVACVNTNEDTNEVASLIVKDAIAEAMNEIETLVQNQQNVLDVKKQMNDEKEVEIDKFSEKEEIEKEQDSNEASKDKKDEIEEENKNKSEEHMKKEKNKDESDEDKENKNIIDKNKSIDIDSTDNSEEYDNFDNYETKESITPFQALALLKNYLGEKADDDSDDSDISNMSGSSDMSSSSNASLATLAGSSVDSDSEERHVSVVEHVLVHVDADMAEIKAATRIQASYRGYNTRKRLGETKENDKENQSKENNEANMELNAHKNEEGKLELDENGAAARIQAGYRGMRVRRDRINNKSVEVTDEERIKDSAKDEIKDNNINEIDDINIDETLAVNNDDAKESNNDENEGINNREMMRQYTEDSDEDSSSSLSSSTSSLSSSSSTLSSSSLSSSLSSSSSSLSSSSRTDVELKQTFAQHSIEEVDSGRVSLHSRVSKKTNEPQIKVVLAGPQNDEIDHNNDDDTNGSEQGENNVENREDVDQKDGKVVKVTEDLTGNDDYLVEIENNEDFCKGENNDKNQNVEKRNDGESEEGFSESSISSSSTSSFESTSTSSITKTSPSASSTTSSSSSTSKASVSQSTSESESSKSTSSTSFTSSTSSSSSSSSISYPNNDV